MNKTEKKYEVSKRRLDLLKYLFEVSFMSPFTIGKVTFHIDDKKIYLYYKKNGEITSSMEVLYDTNTMVRYPQIKKTVQEFIINAYYYNERSGKPIDAKIIGRLLGIEQNVAIQAVIAIKDKIKGRMKTLYGDECERIGSSL